MMRRTALTEILYLDFIFRCWSRSLFLWVWTIVFFVGSSSLFSQQLINTSSAYRVVVEIPVVNVGTLEKPQLMPSVEVYGSGVTVEEITPISDRNIDYSGDESQYVKRSFIVSPSSSIRLGVVNEYRFARGLSDVAVGTAAVSSFRWEGGVTSSASIVVAGTPSNLNPDRGFVMTLTAPSLATGGSPLGGKTIYKQTNIIATLTLRVQVSDEIGGRKVLSKGVSPTFAGSAVGMSFGNPIVLSSFQDLLALQGLIRMFQEGSVDYNNDCYGYFDAVTEATKVYSYREALDQFQAKGIDYSRYSNVLSSPQATSEFFASQYYSITEGVTLTSSYSGLGQPPMNANGAVSLSDLTSKISGGKSTPFIGFIECSKNGSVSMQYHDSRADAYYKFYGFLKMFGDNSSLCVARNLRIQGLIDVHSSDETTASGRISGGLAAMLYGKNAFLINGTTALSSDVSSGGEVISGGVVGYMYSDAALPSYALYDRDSPPDALEQEFDYHSSLDNIGSQFRADSRKSSTCLSGGVGYAQFGAQNGGISRLEVSIEQGQLLTRAFTHAYLGGVVARLETNGGSSLRGCQTRSTRGFDMRASSENIVSGSYNVYSGGLAGYLSNISPSYTLQLFNNALVTAEESHITIQSRDEYVESRVNLYAGAYYGCVNQPTRSKLMFRSARSHQDGKVDVQIVQNGMSSGVKAVGGIVAYGLPLLDFPTTPGYVFELKAKGVSLSIEEKSTTKVSPSRGNSYGAFFCGYPDRSIGKSDFNRCDFTFTDCNVSIQSEFGSNLGTFKYYAGGLLGAASSSSTSPLVLDSLRMTLDHSQISALQRSFSTPAANSNVYAGGIVGFSGVLNSSLTNVALVARNNSQVVADQAGYSTSSEPFAGGLVGYSSGTSYVDCAIRGELPSGVAQPTESMYALGVKLFNRNNGNTPGVGGIVGMTYSTVNSFDPDDPYNGLSVLKRACLMARCKVDKVFVYGYGYNQVASSGYDVMIGGLIGCARCAADGSVAVRCEVENSLMMGDAEDKVELAVGGVSGTDWTGCSGVNPIYDRCLVRNSVVLAKGQNQWAGVGGIVARRFADDSADRLRSYIIANCLVLDTRLVAHTLSHVTFGGGIYGSSRATTDKVRLESCFSNAEFLMINPDPTKIYYGGLAAGGFVPSTSTSTSITTNDVVVAVNSFFHLQNAGTNQAWSRSTMSNGAGYELDFSNKYLITWESLSVFNPKSVTGGSNVNSFNLQQSSAGLYPYSSSITYAGGVLSNDTVMHEPLFNSGLSPASWTLRRKSPRPRGSRVPAELWVSPWKGAPQYKLGEIFRVIVTPDSVTQVTPSKVHLHEGGGITGHEYGLPIEELETQYNDPTPIQLTSYSEVAEDGGVPVDPDNYKDERRIVKWWYSRDPSVGAMGKFLTTFLSGSIPTTFVETGYHLAILCTDPILKDEVFYVQTSDFRETKFSVPVKVTIRYIPPISIAIDPIYGSRSDRGSQAKPFLLLPNSSYNLHSVVEPALVSNGSHTYSFSNVSPSSTLLKVTAGGTIFTGSTALGTVFKITVGTIAFRGDPFNSPATDEIWCKIASPVPVAVANDVSSVAVAPLHTVIDALSVYSFKMSPVVGFTYHTALQTPKNVKITLEHASGNEVVNVVVDGVIQPQSLMDLPVGFDWTKGDFSLNPGVLSDRDALNPITRIVIYFEFYKQINITFDHNDGRTFYVYSLHEGGQLSQIPGIDLATEPGLNPNFPGLSFKGWLEQRTPTVEFTAGYDITKPFLSSLRLYAILSLEFQYAVTHDSYVTYVNCHPSLNGALSPPTLAPSDRVRPTFGIVRPESLQRMDYVNLNQVPIVLNSGIRFNVYLTVDKKQPNNILFYKGLTGSAAFSDGAFERVTFQYLGRTVEEIEFSSGVVSSLYCYTYYIPQSELLSLQSKGRLFFVFDNIYKVSHQTMGVKPLGAPESDSLYYHRDEIIQHSSYPRLSDHVYVGWKGATSKSVGGNYEVGDLMPEQEVVLRGKWAVAQVKPSVSNHFFVDDVTDQALYDHLYLSLQDACSSAMDGQVVQLMANTKEDVVFDRRIVYDSKFTKMPESVSTTENKVLGSVILAANADLANRVGGSANVRLENDLLTSRVGIEAHALGNKAQVDYNGYSIRADRAFLDLSIPLLGTFEDFYAWYPINLPFDCRVSSVTNSSGERLMHPEEFGVAEYSGVRRATYGVGNSPDLWQNDWLYIAPDVAASDYHTRDLTILSKYVGGDQLMKANIGYMVNGRRKRNVLRFHALSGTFSDVSVSDVVAYSGSANEVHHGWNYVAQPLGVNATVDVNTLSGLSSIIQVSNDYSSDIPEAIRPGKREGSYVAIDLGVSPDYVIGPYTNFFYQSNSNRSIGFVPSSNQANTRSVSSSCGLPRYGFRLIAPTGDSDNLFVSVSSDVEAAGYR